MASEMVVIIFAKPPRGGGAKTRLAAEVGRGAADALAEAFLADTWAMVSALPGVRAVVATTDVEASHGVPRAALWDQGTGGLGARLERMARRGIDSGSTVCLLGADSPGLPEAHLRACQTYLREVDAVLGPARDGGFTLLGLRRFPAGMLDDIPWSTAAVAERTRCALHDAGLRTLELPMWFDIDDLDDLRHFAATVPRRRAPRTWAVLPPEVGG